VRAAWVVGASAARGAVELALEVRDRVVHLLLALLELPDLLAARRIPFRRQLADVVDDVALLLLQLVDFLDRRLRVPPRPVLPSLLELPARVLEAPERGVRFRGRAGASGLRRGLAHRLGGLLEIPGRLLQLPVVRLPGEALQLPCSLLGLLGEIAL
jgi:hypothetical protein